MGLDNQGILAGLSPEEILARKEMEGGVQYDDPFIPESNVIQTPTREDLEARQTPLYTPPHVLDPALEEAGRDLYANPRQVFWKITFPLLLPGISAAALLSFALSFDDFIITNFNAGPVDTFPKFVYTAAAKGIPAEANVIGSAVFLVAIIAVVLVQLNSARKQKRLLAGK